MFHNIQTESWAISKPFWLHFYSTDHISICSLQPLGGGEGDAGCCRDWSLTRACQAQEGSKISLLNTRARQFQERSKQYRQLNTQGQPHPLAPLSRAPLSSCRGRTVHSDWKSMCSTLSRLRSEQSANLFDYTSLLRITWVFVHYSLWGCCRDWSLTRRI